MIYLGKDSIDRDKIQRCVNRLDRDLKAIGTTIALVPSWMADGIPKIKTVKHW
jgi:hypothetical protein